MIRDRIVRAYIFAQEKHGGQKRRYSGLDYFCHPKGVARKVEDLTRDEDLIIAALLHDVVEDCGITIPQIGSLFGANVARLVSQLSTPEYDKTQVKKIDMLTDNIINMDDDAFTVKLCDRWDNVQWMDKDCKTTEQRAFVKKYYDETRELIIRINNNRTKTKLHNSIIRMIEAELDYIKIKHLW